MRYSGTAANGATETISPLIFHPAFPIQPLPLRGTSFHRKEGVSTQAPSLGRGRRAQQGGVASFFGAAKPPPLCLPHWGRGTVSVGDRVLSYIVDLRRISPLIFHTASTLSGSLRSPPSPRGEGFDTEIPLPSIQPPPLRGTSFHRKEGVSTQVPSLGRGCRAQRGGVGFLLGRRSRLQKFEGRDLGLVARD